MLNVFFQKFPNAVAKYRFKCRNADVNLLEFRDEIDEELDSLCELKHTKEELEYLKSIRFFGPAFINYLEDYTLKRRYIKTSEKNGDLDIFIDGPITGASMFEIYTLKIVHGVYSRNINPFTEELKVEGEKRLNQKIKKFYDFIDATGIVPQIIEFGSRRAYSSEWHSFVVKKLVENKVIIGTSDVNLAMKLGITPIGTMAHELIQSYQGLNICPVMESQSKAFQTWADVYRGDLGIFLSDTLGDKKFLIDFDNFFAKLADGIRHDSGPAIPWGEKMIDHYHNFGIDPRTKTLVFSDGLDFPKVFELVNQFEGRIKTSYGVGTNLSNDLGVQSLQNVIKQVSVNGNTTCKLSNDVSKMFCDDKEYVNYLRNCLDRL